MATDDDERSPFTRPGFIAAAVVIALVVALGIVLVIVNSKEKRDPAPPPTSAATTSSAPSTGATAVAGGGSVCGLDGSKGEGARLTTAPDVDEWAYQGTTAYPTSAVYGPGAADAAGGFRYCFQQSPEGALFAASFILAAGTGQSSAWVEYYAAPGPYRDALLEEPAGDAGSTDARLRIAGFRLLAYDGTSARIDLAVVAGTQAESVTASFVYDLVWVDGDWKIDTSTPEPGNFSTIPDLTGYVPWGE